MTMHTLLVTTRTLGSYLLLVFLLVLSTSGKVRSEDAKPLVWKAGVSKVEITPREPVRLSGYGNRAEVHEAVETPLFVRCFALCRNIDEGTSASVHLLFAVDTIGLPAKLTNAWAKELQQRYSVSREQIVFSTTHTHCGPHLVDGLTNLFSTPLTDAEIAASERYTEFLRESLMQSASEAVESMQPARLVHGQGTVDFAANRRVIVEGKWRSIGVQSDSPVDHSVPFLRVEDETGNVRGMVFNYACHCTTLGTNRVNGDWAGYATAALESQFPGAVALCTIGCGADANPNPRGTNELAMLHGRAMAKEVARLVDEAEEKVDQPLVARYDVAAASFDLPTIEEIRARKESANPQTRRHAQLMEDLYKEEGRLPATYPIPIQSWKFGDQLTMIFIGGEVVVDYALRLKRELGNDNLWVSAYSNDVMGYVCSERMRAEGGYEYDGSSIYYGLPGPWASGTEELLIEKIKTLVAGRGRPQPLSPESALQSFRLTEGFEIQLVAAEPLVCDPINLAFGPDGRLWVVEMGDYPEGTHDKEKQDRPGIDHGDSGESVHGGCIKVLTDHDGDGRYDSAKTFLEGLEFPTGVFPYRDGVIVTAAPELFFAADRDGDGRAEVRETLVSGFVLANPQHRINGFTYGLDHSVHLASGDQQQLLRNHRNEEVINGAGADFQWILDRELLKTVSGQTQFVRSRNAWGEWFGSDNSHPMYHYVVDVRYLRRNSALALRTEEQQLFMPPTAPPVFPMTSGDERLNDLFAANRFTSACSSIVVDDVFGFGDEDAILVCEPVHNLVHRSRLVSQGSSYVAQRDAVERETEWLASSDPWFRPVRSMAGPDGAIYIADMYRETIEHPEWIPGAWRELLDLRAGSDRGRIYRVCPQGWRSPGTSPVDSASIAQLVELLESPFSAQRDLAHQQLCERGLGNDIGTLEASVASSNADEVEQRVRMLLQSTEIDVARVHALWILRVLGRLTEDDVRFGLGKSDRPTLSTAIELSEPYLEQSRGLLEDVLTHTESTDPHLLVRVALALGASEDDRAGEGLQRLIQQAPLDQWLVTAILSSAYPHAESVLRGIVTRLLKGEGDPEPSQVRLLEGALKTLRAKGGDVETWIGELLESASTTQALRLRLAVVCASADLGAESSKRVAKTLQPLHSLAVTTLRNPDSETELRCLATNLLGRGLVSSAEERSLLLELIDPSVPVEVQESAIEALARLGGKEIAIDFVVRWDSMSQRIREVVAQEMLRIRPWHEALISGLEDGRIRVSDLSLATRQQLRLSGSRSQQVRVDRVLGQVRDVDLQFLVDQYFSATGIGGDITAGEQLYRQHCAVCHSADDSGRTVGPSLQNLSDRSPRALLQSILNPNGNLEPKYQTVAIETRDGRVLSGIIEGEDERAISLVGADGKRVVLERSNIEQLRNTGVSLMPTGFQQQLPPEQMQHLLRYLIEGMQ